MAWPVTTQGESRFSVVDRTSPAGGYRSAGSGHLPELLPEGSPKPVANQGLGVRRGACVRQGMGQNDATRNVFFGAPGSIAGARFTTRNNCTVALERQGADHLFHELVHFQGRCGRGESLPRVRGRPKPASEGRVKTSHLRKGRRVWIGCPVEEGGCPFSQ